MLGKKIILNDRIRDLIIDSRKSIKDQNPLLTADYISEKIGRAKSWLSQVENGRLKSVKTSDLINVFCILKDKNKDCPEDRKYVEEYLDDQIQYILVTQKHGIYDEHGNVLDFSEMLLFQSTRGHLQFAGKKIIDEFYELLDMPIEQIENNLKKRIKYIFSYIVEWINRAFNDTSELFSDEISTRNLFILIQTSINIYEGNCDYFGLNHLNITDSDIHKLKEKLDTDCFFKEKTIDKPINEYSRTELDEVIKHFSSEEYMTWENKHVYTGDDPFPMLVNFVDYDSGENNFVSFQDINKATGLSENKYLYIIKQIYDQFDVMYKRCKDLLRDNSDIQEENDELFSEIEQLREELDRIKKSNSK